MWEHTPWPQPPVPAPRPGTPEPHPWPRPPETHPLGTVEFSGLVMPQKPPPVAPTLGEAEGAEMTSDVDVDQQLLGESASGDSHPDVSLPDVPLTESRSDSSVGDGCCVRVRVGSMSCEFLLLWSIDVRQWLRHMWRCCVRLGYRHFPAL